MSLEKNLIAQLRAEQEDVKKIMQHIEARERLVKAREERVRQNLLTPDGVKSAEAQVKSALPSYLAPGNIGDINRVIWPFYFMSSRSGVLSPNGSIRTSINITQEAAFVWTGVSKAVYEYDQITGLMTYIQPNDDATIGQAPGLRVSMRDAQSQREFFGRQIDLDHIGNPRFPLVLSAPQILQPNAVMEVNFSNTNQVQSYVVQLMFHGYRVRIENAQDLLSFVYG